MAITRTKSKPKTQYSLILSKINSYRQSVNKKWGVISKNAKVIGSKLNDSKLFYLLMLALFILLNAKQFHNSYTDIQKILTKIKSIVPPKQQESTLNRIGVIFEAIRKNGMVLETMSLPFQLLFLKSILENIFLKSWKCSTNELFKSNVSGIINVSVKSTVNKFFSKDSVKFKLVSELLLVNVLQNYARSLNLDSKILDHSR